MGSVEDFVKASREIWGFIEKNQLKLQRLVQVYGYMYARISTMFNVSTAFTKELASKIPQLAHLTKASLLGLHAAMYHDIGLVAELIDEKGYVVDEVSLSEVLGLSVEDMRVCLLQSFGAMLSGDSLTHRIYAGEREICSAYWKRGVLLPHLGVLLIEVSKNPPKTPPRLIGVNALVPWILGVLRDLASGSLGAGSIAIVSASIGKGKTTTLYYTIRSVLNALSPGSSHDELTSKLIILDAEEFLDILQALVDSEVKAPIIVVDNASVLFPKQWFKLGGAMVKFYLNMNTIIDLLRGVCGATIFVANAPGEISSFVRNAATMNIVGREESGIRAYSTTLFTWKRPVLKIREEEETVKLREKIASVYVYPLLKLPREIYERDLEVKVKVIKSTVQNTIEHLKNELLMRQNKTSISEKHAIS